MPAKGWRKHKHENHWNPSITESEHELARIAAKKVAGKPRNQELGYEYFLGGALEGLYSTRPEKVPPEPSKRRSYLLGGAYIGAFRIMDLDRVCKAEREADHTTIHAYDAPEKSHGEVAEDLAMLTEPMRSIDDWIDFKRAFYNLKPRYQLVVEHWAMGETVVELAKTIGIKSKSQAFDLKTRAMKQLSSLMDDGFGAALVMLAAVAAVWAVINLAFGIDLADATTIVPDGDSKLGQGMKDAGKTVEDALVSYVGPIASIGGGLAGAFAVRSAGGSMGMQAASGLGTAAVVSFIPIAGTTTYQSSGSMGADFGAISHSVSALGDGFVWLTAVVIMTAMILWRERRA